MFKTALIVATAALSLTGASITTSSSAQAGGFGKFVAAGIVGAVIGSALASRAASRPSYAGGYGGGYRPAYRPVVYGCGFSVHPVFDGYGNQVGVQRVPTC